MTGVLRPYWEIITGFDSFIRHHCSTKSSMFDHIWLWTHFSWTNPETDRSQSTERNLFLPHGSEQLCRNLWCSQTGGRALMLQNIPSTFLSKHVECLLHSCRQVSKKHLPVYEVSIKKVLQLTNTKTSHLEPSDVPKMTSDIKALPSYINYGCELCFCKAVVGSICPKKQKKTKTKQQTFKCNQVFCLL